VFYTMEEDSITIDGMTGDGTLYYTKLGSCGEASQVLCCINATTATSVDT